MQLPAHLFEPNAPWRARRPLAAPMAEVFPCTASDGTNLVLTRFRGGSRGPLILVPGLGVSSLIFLIDTIGINLVEYLCKRDFDVWLFDCRTSTALGCSRDAYTADRVAQADFPAAIATVRRATSSPTVQILGHDFGGATLFMAIAGGVQGIRSAVFSQLAGHVVMPAHNRIRSLLHSPALLHAIGMKTFDGYFDVRAASPNVDVKAELKLHTGATYCGSPLCSRITFMFGPLYRHDHVNDPTHAVLHELFGAASTRAFEHLLAMAARGHVVSAMGEDYYMPNVDRFAFPIAFLHGAENQAYLPKGTALTHERLCQANGERWYRHDVIPGYGHHDCIFGANAASDVYPRIAEHLAST